MELATLSKMQRVNQKERRETTTLTRVRSNTHLRNDAYIESLEIWRGIQKRFKYDQRLKEIILAEISNSHEFHAWRMETFPLRKPHYVLSFMYNSSDDEPESLSNYGWLPRDIWTHFFLGYHKHSVYQGVQASSKTDGHYNAKICFEGKTTYLGSTETAFAAHQLWQAAKLAALQKLVVKYRNVVDEKVIVWLEYWMMKLEGDIYRNEPTWFLRESRIGGEDASDA